RHTRSKRDWSSDVCSSDLYRLSLAFQQVQQDGYHLCQCNVLANSMRLTILVTSFMHDEIVVKTGYRLCKNDEYHQSRISASQCDRAPFQRQNQYTLADHNQPSPALLDGPSLRLKSLSSRFA